MKGAIKRIMLTAEDKKENTIEAFGSNNGECGDMAGNGINVPSNYNDNK